MLITTGTGVVTYPKGDALVLSTRSCCTFKLDNMTVSLHNGSMAEIPHRLVPISDPKLGPNILKLDLPEEDGVRAYRRIRNGFIVISGLVAPNVVLDDFVREAEEAFSGAERLGWVGSGVSRAIIPPLKDMVSDKITVTIDVNLDPTEQVEEEPLECTNCVDDQGVHETENVRRPMTTEELETLGFDATGFSFMRLDCDRMALCYAPAGGHFEAGFYHDPSSDNPGVEFAAAMIAPQRTDVPAELGRLVALLS